MPPSLAVPARRVLPLVLMLIGTSAAQAQRRAEDWELSCSQIRGDRRGEHTCEIIERTIAAGSALTVDSRVNGGINVIGERRRDVLVRARVEAHARTQRRAEELAEGVRVSVEPGRISADGPDTRNNEWWVVSFEVHVPAGSNLDLRAHNGGIGVIGVTGTLRMDTQNGGIHLEAVGGDVVAETMNGGLHIELTGDRWEGKGLDATTLNGGVQMRIPQGYSARLETGTVNGGIDIDFPVMVRGRIGQRITTELGSGGATIRATTTNGGVRIRRE